MAFRALNHWRSLYRSVMTRTTTPKPKSFATSTVDSGEAGRAKTKGLKGDYVPVYVVLGLIGVSVSLGLYSVMHQLKHSPNVVVSKKKRESFPELGDMEDADKFVKKSFFRKVAHIQESDHREQSVPDPIRGDTFAHQGSLLRHVASMSAMRLMGKHASVSTQGSWHHFTVPMGVSKGAQPVLAKRNL